VTINHLTQYQVDFFHRLGQVLELHEVEADALVLLTSPHIDRMDLASGERSLLESIIAIAHTWSSDHADG
jgi:hypothetical protein